MEMRIYSDFLRPLELETTFDMIPLMLMNVHWAHNTEHAINFSQCSQSESKQISQIFQLFQIASNLIVWLFYPPQPNTGHMSDHIAFHANEQSMFG